MSIKLKALSLSTAIVMGLNGLLIVQPAHATCGPLTGFVPGTDIGFLATGPISLAARALECVVTVPPVVVPPVIPPVVPPVITPPVTPPAIVSPAASPISVTPTASPVTSMSTPTAPPSNVAHAAVAGSNYDTVLLTNIWTGLVVAEVSYILYQVITGQNRPPAGLDTLVCEGFIAPASGRAFRFQKNRTAYSTPAECKEPVDSNPAPVVATPVFAPLNTVSKPSIQPAKKSMKRKLPVKRLPKKG